MKNSKLLDTIYDRIKNAESNPSSAVTAERFLVAVIEAIGDCEINAGEIQSASDIFDELGVDILELRKELIEYIERDNGTSAFSDSMYMQKQQFAARQAAVKNKLEEVTVDLLLKTIFSQPSDSIQLCVISLLNPMSADQVDPIEPAEADPFDDEAEQTDKEEDRLDILRRRTGRDYKRVRRLRPLESDADNSKAAMDKLVESVKFIRDELSKSVFGQDNAINVFATGYFRSCMLSMLDNKHSGPKATFLFAGPPGVGKTFLAECVASALKLPYRRFDMSEYADKEANFEFCGSDKVYKNGKAGNVTSFVEENPECVLLFDEIEKAHINVIHLFLQMLDAGRLRDNFTDNEVSFSKVIIILTTNAGRQLYEGEEGDDLSCVSRKVILKALKTDVKPETNVPFFPPAICSRFASGNIVMFNHITAGHLRTIAKNEIGRTAARLNRKLGFKLDIGDSVYTALLFAEGAFADARTVRGRAEAFINDELYELFRLVASEKVKTSVGDINEILVDVDLSKAGSEVASLFIQNEPTKLLVFADEKIRAFAKGELTDFDLITPDDAQSAIGAVKTGNIGFVLLDLKYGPQNMQSDSLNIEDIDSQARELYRYLREMHRDIPIYLLDTRGELSAEERFSLVRQGARGVLEVNCSDDRFAEKVREIGADIYQQSSLSKLASANKLVSFETSQSISADGSRAVITLFDFKCTAAIDSEDSASVVDSLSRPTIRFDDVIGAGDAKDELRYFVEYLKNPGKYLGTGVKAPKGVLLYGPPGTGKTLLAKAMAGESDVTFIAAQGNQFLKSYVGEGSSEVHKLFATARKYAPAILFIDEIDAIAKERRGAALQSSGSEDTLTAFLTEMDGFSTDTSKPVFVLAATNFDVEPGSAKSLDPALMRRFDRRICIELPTREERIRFMNMKISANKALAISDGMLENLAMRSTGMSLAQLDSVIELALRSAIRVGAERVDDAILEEAFETFNGGEIKKWSPDSLERVARHEAGHTLLCICSGELPSYLTIVARGSHGGYMQHAENEDKQIYTKQELLMKIRTSLAGRAAELVYYGEKDGVTTGAASDLANATAVAQALVCSYGMDERFGLAIDKSAVGEMSDKARAAVNAILDEQLKEAVRIITENRARIDALVAQLLLKNRLNDKEIAVVVGEDFINRMIKK